MSDVQRHYETLLGPVYEWSVSGAGDPFKNAAAWLAALRLDRGASYLDLGAGFGAHVLPLARAGKSVTAVDLDESLLKQLRDRLDGEGLHASLHRREILEFLRTAPPTNWDVVLCLGDTLCHLPSILAVREFLSASARVLKPGGLLALSYRDSTRLAAEGTARFREVARDDKRVMHCLIEPLDAEHLRVTDILTEVGPQSLNTRISDYIKVRIAPEQLSALATQVGLVVESEDQDRGFVVQVLSRAG